MLRILLATLFYTVTVSAEIQTVSYVDISKYMGTWYQISSNPLPFEAGCHCSRQKLELLPTGKVSVFNSCNIGSVGGPLNTIRGEAENIDPVTNAKFKVDFGFPEKGDYWIIALDARYRYAVVSDPSEKSLFILSRSPQLDEVLYEQALNQAQLQLDISALQVMTQNGCTYPVEIMDQLITF